MTQNPTIPPVRVILRATFIVVLPWIYLYHIIGGEVPFWALVISMGLPITIFQIGAIAMFIGDRDNFLDTNKYRQQVGMNIIFLFLTIGQYTFTIIVRSVIFPHNGLLAVLSLLFILFIGIIISHPYAKDGFEKDRREIRGSTDAPCHGGAGGIG